MTNQWLKVICTTLFMTLVSPTVFSAEIYLFRHAEKQKDGTRDPALTQSGHKRALWLAQYLKDKNIKTIYSSDYKRTRQTVEPLAKALNLEIKLYNPGKQATLITKLKKSKHNAVVAGHSNTIPTTVELLGGDPGKPIDEKEYNRLYQLTLKKDKVTTQLHHSELVK